MTCSLHFSTVVGTTNKVNCKTNKCFVPTASHVCVDMSDTAASSPDTGRRPGLVAQPDDTTTSTRAPAPKAVECTRSSDAFALSGFAHLRGTYTFTGTFWGDRKVFANGAGTVFMYYLSAPFNVWIMGDAVGSKSAFL